MALRTFDAYEVVEPGGDFALPVLGGEVTGDRVPGQRAQHAPHLRTVLAQVGAGVLGGATAG
ncbi:hypothetical protein ACFY20_45340 [Streptomyces sp. NPDC001312]|uniref:hypothetical protein n=1 Tax=Streptomyces sp. NPDC001312 TaxID=3364561 RepID=UPI0036813F04